MALTQIISGVKETHLPDDVKNKIILKLQEQSQDLDQRVTDAHLKSSSVRSWWYTKIAQGIITEIAPELALVGKEIKRETYRAIYLSIATIDK